MPRSKIIDVRHTSSTDFDSSQDSLDSLTGLPLENHATTLQAQLPSSVTINPRRSIKGKRSLVWRYFKILDNNSFDAECILCSTTVTRTSASTSNLLYHIQVRHDSEFQIVNKNMKSKQPVTLQRLPLSSNRSSELTRLAADLIIRNLLPVSIIESPQLQLIFQEAEPSYVLPKRKYFINNVLHQMYMETRQKVQNELKYAIGICLTTDIWTSQANQPYMTITAHIVDLANIKLKCYVLETTEFSGNHTAERILDRLENTCIEWNILDKIVCLVSDNCNVMRKVGNDFSKGWFGCADHLINLCVGDIIRKLDEIQNIVGIVRRIVSFVRDSHLAKETLNKHQNSFGSPERQLIYDVVTRWNSTFYMLRRFIDEKMPILACLNEKSFQKNLLKAKIGTNIDWNMLEQLMLILEPFESATRKLAGDCYPSMSIVLPVVTTLITSLEGRSVDSPIITKIKNSLRRSIEERFKNIFEDKIVLLTTVLDPRWKNFTFLQSSSYQNHNETLASLNKLRGFDAKLLAYIHLHDEYLSYSMPTYDTFQSNSEENMSSEDSSDFFDIMVTSQPVTNSANSDPEFTMYENEREITRSGNPLEWWRGNKIKYPKLSQIAFKFLCIAASSTPSERMFSASGHLTSDRRSRLTPENANVLLFLNKNA